MKECIIGFYYTSILLKFHQNCDDFLAFFMKNAVTQTLRNIFIKKNYSINIRNDITKHIQNEFLHFLKTVSTATPKKNAPKRKVEGVHYTVLPPSHICRARHLDRLNLMKSLATWLCLTVAFSPTLGGLHPRRLALALPRGARLVIECSFRQIMNIKLQTI